MEGGSLPQRGWCLNHGATIGSCEYKDNIILSSIQLTRHIKNLCNTSHWDWCGAVFAMRKIGPRDT